VSALKWVMTCESGKGPSSGVRLLYQFESVVMSSVIVSGLCCAASLAQWRACWVSLSVWGWAYPLPNHLCWKAEPIDPKTLSRGNVEENCVICVGHVTGDEKYDCVMWKDSMRCARMSLGSVYCENLRGSFLGNLYL
jgi:hypothetical protein